MQQPYAAPSALEILERTFKPIAIPPAPRPAGRFCGVYLLVSGTAIVYVGRSEEVNFRVRRHFSKRAGKFDRALWMPLSLEQQLDYEGALIRRLAPRFNRRGERFRGLDNEILFELGLDPHEDTHAAVEKWRHVISNRRYGVGFRP